MHRIKAMKDKLIKEAQNRMDNIDGGSIEQMGQIIDMIKDLSEAEKACLEAEYYDTVIDAMDGSDGYDGYRGQGSTGSQGGRSGRSGRTYGYREDDDMEGYRNSRGQYARKPSRRRMRRYGYSDDSIDNIREMMEEADPERKKQLKRDLQELMQEM